VATAVIDTTSQCLQFGFRLRLAYGAHPIGGMGVAWPGCQVNPAVAGLRDGRACWGRIVATEQVAIALALAGCIIGGYVNHRPL
jgi:hypothetical protein